MLAFAMKNSEAVGLVILRGPGKQTSVKSTDHKIRSKLFRLFNTSFNSLTNTLTDGGCEARVDQLIPGTEEHFLAVVNYVNSNTGPEYVMTTLGS